jgi:hypothetical protein
LSSKLARWIYVILAVMIFAVAISMLLLAGGCELRDT